jgi:hypothetical protein
MFRDYIVRLFQHDGYEPGTEGTEPYIWLTAPSGRRIRLTVEDIS